MSSTERTRLLGDDGFQADPADVAEQRRAVDPDPTADDYPWVRRDEVLTIDGHRYFV